MHANGCCASKTVGFGASVLEWMFLGTTLLATNTEAGAWRFHDSELIGTPCRVTTT